MQSSLKTAVWTLRLLRRTATDIRQIGSTDFQRMTDVRKGGIEADKEDTRPRCA
jgi:hypothetical protein